MRTERAQDRTHSVVDFEELHIDQRTIRKEGENQLSVGVWSHRSQGEKCFQEQVDSCDTVECQIRELESVHRLVTCRCRVILGMRVSLR